MPSPTVVSAFAELSGFIEEAAEADVPADQKWKNLGDLSIEVRGEKRLTDDERDHLLSNLWSAAEELSEEAE